MAELDTPTLLSGRLYRFLCSLSLWVNQRVCAFPVNNYQSFGKLKGAAINRTINSLFHISMIESPFKLTDMNCNYFL